MKKLFLLSNAHIDHVWLWEWQEGATATVATFRAAADICEEFDGLIMAKMLPNGWQSCAVQRNSVCVTESKPIFSPLSRAAGMPMIPS